MAFSPENIARNRESFLDRRHLALEASENKKQQLYRDIPALAEMDRQIASVGSRVMAAALRGGDVAGAVEKMREENRALRQKRAELLVANGYPADYTDIRYRCEACGDTGFIGTKMCRCMRDELVMAGYESSGIGRLMQTQSFESFSLDYYPAADRQGMEANLRTLREFAAHFDTRRGENYLLIGTTGLGKTHLMHAIGHSIRKNFPEKKVLYVSSEMFTNELIRAIRENRQMEFKNKYRSIDVFMLDDIQFIHRECSEPFFAHRDRIGSAFGNFISVSAVG